MASLRMCIELEKRERDKLMENYDKEISDLWQGVRMRNVDGDHASCQPRQ